MNWLLPEIAAEVARYLTPRDLSACTSVSIHWREVFGSNQVWKPHCDLDLEEHLRTTPCVVEPKFQLPQAPGSSLAPISQWRAAFLREHHMWENWQRGNFNTENYIFKDGEAKPFNYGFISDELIIIFCQKFIRLYNVKVVPPKIVSEYYYTQDSFYDPIIYGNGWVIIKCHRRNIIQAIKVDVVEEKITLKYCIYFNQSIELVCSARGMETAYGRYPLDHFDIVILGTRCVGNFRLKQNFNKFYILDFESGNIVKDDEHLPCQFDSGFLILGPNKWSQNCHDVLVVGKNDPDETGRASVLCHVYDVEQLTFFHFKHRFWTPDSLLFRLGYAFCAIINNFVAISECGNAGVKVVRIFNYRTGSQLHVIESFSDVESIYDSYFLFMTIYESDTPTLSIVNPAGEIIKHVTDFHSGLFRVMGRKLVQNQWANNFFWHISHSRHLKIFKTAIKFPKVKEVNQAGTRLILDGMYHKELTIIYLW